MQSKLTLYLNFMLIQSDVVANLFASVSSFKQYKCVRYCCLSENKTISFINKALS